VEWEMSGMIEERRGEEMRGEGEERWCSRVERGRRCVEMRCDERR
jgi:hypothetical protein